MSEGFTKSYNIVNGTACSRCGKLFYFIGDTPPICGTCETATLRKEVTCLEREKALLHERVEELEEQVQSAMMSPSGTDLFARAHPLQGGPSNDTDLSMAQAELARMAMGETIVVPLAEYESLKADAEKWRKAFISVMDRERVEQSIKDRDLGALVRKMPCGLMLHRDGEKWACGDGSRMNEQFDTPEEALRAAGIE